MRTAHLRRSAALALGLALLVTGALAPAALAFTRGPDDLPDLTMTLTSSVPSGSTNLAEPGGPVTWYLTIKNPSIQVWDPELRRYYTGGAPVSGLMVRDWLPDGSQFLSASADSGFSCSYASMVVTCLGGAIANGGTAHITINTNAPPLMAQYWTTATADPNNTIAERSETNNAKVVPLNVLVLN